MSDKTYTNERDTYEELQAKYEKSRVELKRQKYKNRKVNRKKYNLAREEAAQTDVIKELRNKYRTQITDLQDKLRTKTERISDLEEECGYRTTDNKFMRQKYLASLAFGVISSVAYLITLKGIEHCVCE
mgnify:CR=1 FL=1